MRKAYKVRRVKLSRGQRRWMLKRLVLAFRKIDLSRINHFVIFVKPRSNPSVALPLRLLPNQVVYSMYLSKLLHTFVKKVVTQLSRTQPQPSVGSLIELKPKTKLQYSLFCFLPLAMFSNTFTSFCCGCQKGLLAGSKIGNRGNLGPFLLFIVSNTFEEMRCQVTNIRSDLTEFHCFPNL